MENSTAILQADAARKAVGRPKKAERPVRLQVTVPASLNIRLLEIQDETHRASIAEVFRDALTLYAAAVEERKKGGRLFFKKNGENEREINIFI